MNEDEKCEDCGKEFTNPCGWCEDCGTQDDMEDLNLILIRELYTMKVRFNILGYISIATIAILATLLFLK